MTLKFVIELWKCIVRVGQLSSVISYITVSNSMSLNLKIACNFVKNMHIAFFWLMEKKMRSNDPSTSLAHIAIDHENVLLSSDTRQTSSLDLRSGH